MVLFQPLIEVRMGFEPTYVGAKEAVFAGRDGVVSMKWAGASHGQSCPGMHSAVG